jgi:hypothetical protein
MFQTTEEIQILRCLCRRFYKRLISSLILHNSKC